MLLNPSLVDLMYCRFLSPTAFMVGAQILAEARQSGKDSEGGGA